MKATCNERERLTEGLSLRDVCGIDQQVCEWVVPQGIVVIGRSLCPKLYCEILRGHAAHFRIQCIVVLKGDTAA